MSRRWKAEAALLGITFIWGATFVVVKSALADASTLLFLTLRFLLAGATLAYLARHIAPDRRLVGASFVCGSALFCGYLFQTFGLRLTTPTKSAFITGFSVVLVPIILGAAFRRFVGWGPLLGAAAALCGLYLLAMPPAGPARIGRGDLLTLVCAAAFALHIIFLGHYSRRLPPIGLAAGQILVAAFLALASVPWAEPAFFRPSPTVFLGIAATGLLATALAFSVQTWAQQFTPPTHTALIFSLESVFAWLTDWVVFGEKMSARASLGALVILAGIVIAETSRDKGNDEQ